MIFKTNSWIKIKLLIFFSNEKNNFKRKSRKVENRAEDWKCDLWQDVSLGDCDAQLPLLGDFSRLEGANDSDINRAARSYLRLMISLMI